jgi:hypothetical protein
MNTDSLLRVTINFETSHLVFPAIISVLLAMLSLAVIATRWRSIRAAFATGPYWPAGTDSSRFFGTLAVTVIYILAMNWISWLWPNRGLGFLFGSMPFLFAASVLYAHERTPRHLLIASLNAVLAPLVIWYVLFHIFLVSLP